MALPAFVPEACQKAAEIDKCGLNELIGVFKFYAEGLFLIAGSFALIFFVYGGILWLTSGGNEEKIKKGRDVLIQTVIALIIIFTAVTLMEFFYKALTTPAPAEQTLNKTPS